MVACASRGGDRTISLDDYQTALGWILEAEIAMEEIFKALGSRGDSQVMEEAYHFLYKIWMATKDPISEHRLVGFISEKVPAYNVLKILELMERRGMIGKELSSRGMLGWKPLGRPGA